MKNRTDFVSVGVKEQLVQAVRNQWERRARCCGRCWAWWSGWAT